MRIWTGIVVAGFAFGVCAAEDGLVGRWTFDEADGTAVKNAASAAFGGVASKPLQVTEGVLGKAAVFTGAETVRVPAEVVPSGIRELTFSAWVAPASLNGFIEIFRKEDGDNRLLFAFQAGGRFLSVGLNTGGNYAECDAPIAPQELLDGAWHLVAGTFDGGAIRVFLDGREIGSYARQGRLQTTADYRPLRGQRDVLARSGFQPLEPMVYAEPLYIGSASGTSEFYRGRLDDVRFYSRALTAAELAGLYREGGQPARPAAPSEAAKKLYQKGDSFFATLGATRARLLGAGEADAQTQVELHRLIRADYPEAVNRFVVRRQVSPVAWMTLTAAQMLEQAKAFETSFFEYLPLTDMQWASLAPDAITHWEHVRAVGAAYREQAAKTADWDAGALYAALCEMEQAAETRPHTSERVADYRAPTTPETADPTEAAARAALEKDWLFQCGGNPTVARSLEEIGWARALAARLARQGVDFAAELARLAALEAEARQAADAGEKNPALYFRVREAKRAITFKDPALDFDSIVYIDSPGPSGSEAAHETRHRLGYMAVPGGRLLVQKGLSPSGSLRSLMPSAPLHGSFWRPDVSFDGRRVLVSFKPHNEKSFHLYEINADGGGLRQLTGGIFDDLDPVYLPDGENIMFLTTRGYLYVRCMPPTSAFVMARMRLDGQGEGVYIVSRNGEPEYTPSVMRDGRVIYTRWEYTDKPLWRAQSLWTMNADATQVQTFWGNQSVWPDLLKDARQIPGSERVMFTGSAHHNWFSGSVGIIDPGKGFNFPEGLTKVTQDVQWPECGNGPTDPKENDTYHVAGNYTAYYSPYPLNETTFMVSAKRDGKFVLLLMNTDGDRELISEGAYNVWDAQPLRARARPPVAPDRVQWPTRAERKNPQPGVIYSNNVYDDAPEELRGKAKYLRIWSIEHKTYTYWYKRTYVSTGPALSMVQSEGVKKILGTVPVESDGSVSFTAPAGIALHFQLLDENQRALQTMRSFTGVQPGEVRGCLGCHESHVRTPVYAQTGKAITRGPSAITPVPWQDITVGYERYVQPVLDKYCGSCHEDPKSKAFQRLNLTLRPGVLDFKEPYVTLVGSPTWGTDYRTPANAADIAGFGWADTIMVEAIGQRDPKAYATVPPMTKLSYKSRLVERLASGTHHGVKADPDSLLRVIHWVDAMCPYSGAEEVRALADPEFQGCEWISPPPRVQTAPIVQRPGPFHPFFTDDAYDPPAPERINALPAGMRTTAR
ncbi:MAG: hypothetical protein LBW77_03595 [Verrucomicrobiota bacterium]|jgi:hypothetical protein|nr:hypothetical protein [Verrucomicrobiota bacterium]